MSTMLSFDHINVMSLVGVCIDREMPLLIMPFMSNGSVLEYVRQISKGMDYLSQHKLVHRDLAARNCMYEN